MSKGEILEHKGEGLYRVRQKLAVERIQQELTQVQARLAELAVELPTAKLELIQADDSVRDKVQEIDALIPDYAAGADGALQQITALQTELIRLQSEASQLRLKVAELIAEDLANRKRQNQLEQVPEGREMDLWCADYSVELTGEVGLVDINDEGGQGTLIQPGFEDGAAYDAAQDGALFPNLAQSGAQIYLNAALLPGVQKWRPRYRIGTITKLNGDVCDVDLDPAQSSAQDLNINEAETLQQVPIKYMDCNGLAFEEDDRVLVRFTQSGPLVVGFAENPRACSTIGIAFMPGKPYGVFDVTFWGEPLEDEAGNPVNPPLGTWLGSNPTWHMTPKSEGWLIKKGNEANHGRRNWIGPGPEDVLSWDGPVSREFNTFFYDSMPSSGLRKRTAPSGKVFHKGVVVFEASTAPGGFPYVRGAALHKAGEATSLVVVLSDEYIKDATYRLWRVPLGPDYQPTSAPEMIDEFEPAFSHYASSDWYFNASGDRAVCTISEANEYDNPGKSVCVARWSIYGAASVEVLAASTDVIGSQSSNGSGTDVRQEDYGAEPIYADFIGDEEVIAYLQRPGFIRTITSQSSGTGFSASGTSSESISWTKDGRLFLSNGDTLAELPVGQAGSYSRDWSWAFIDGNPSNGVDGSMTISADQGDVFFNSLYGIDARFRFCALSIGLTDWDESVNSVGILDPKTEYPRYDLAGTSSFLTQYRASVWMDGREIFTVAYIDDLTQEASFTRPVPYVDTLPPDPPPASSRDLYRGNLYFWPSEYVMTATAFDRAGYKVVALQVAEPNQDVGLQDDWVRYHYITGYPDPENDLFENPDDNMTMYALTLI